MAPRPEPAAEEERHGERGEDDHVDVLGHGEEAEAHAAVLRLVPGDELGLSLGQVERRAVRLCDSRDEEDGQPDDLRDGVPDRLRLLIDDLRERKRAGHDDHAEDRDGERDLVGHELGAGAHGPSSEYFESEAQPPTMKP